MNKNEMVEKLGLQLFAVAILHVKCNKCWAVVQTHHQAVSLASYHLASKGWTIDGACQVFCPECSDAARMDDDQ